MSAPVPYVLSCPLLVATPGAPSVTSQGTTGATTHSYKLVGLDALGNHTGAGAAGSAADGNATLSALNFQRITWTDPLGASRVQIWRTVGGPTQGLIGTVDAGVQTFDDTGLVADGATAPTTNITGIGTQATLVAADNPSVFIGGTFVADIMPQVSPDGTTWYDLLSAAAQAPDFFDLPTAVAMRIKMTAYTSGTPTAKLLSYRR